MQPANERTNQTKRVVTPPDLLPMQQQQLIARHHWRGPGRGPMAAQSLLPGLHHCTPTSQQQPLRCLQRGHGTLPTGPPLSCHLSGMHLRKDIITA